MEDERDTCFGPGSVAGAVIGTFFTTLLLLAVAALLYRQWRRHKGKHLVLVTDPEIVEDAYAFDNPCFKDATPSVGRTQERSTSIATPADSTPVKDSSRWPTPWTSLGLGTGARNDKRRTLDDSCLGPKATRVSIVSLRSHDFTGLGFNVCGNMREGIFVKDLLHRGPASESGRIHPGDRITSVKISFRNMVYEDALTILSYASPYDVELEVESGGTGSKPATLLKKSVGPSPSRICHPLYRSQSIPEFSRGHKNTAKRLFVADANDSLIGSGGSNYSTMNSTLKSSKSTPGTHTVERIQHDDAITSSTPTTTKSNHHKFGIKVLPALDGTVHRIENQNEHNTNLERRHSKKTNAEQQKQQRLSSNSVNFEATNQLVVNDEKKNRQIRMESIQQKDNPSSVTKRRISNSIDVPDKGEKSSTTVEIPSEVPAEVHNAAMAARRNRKSSAELLNVQKSDKEAIESSESTSEPGPRSPQRNKRKAPAPPKIGSTESEAVNKDMNDKEKQSSPKSTLQQQQQDDSIDTIADYTESLNDYVSKVRDNIGDNQEGSQDETRRQQRLENQRINRRNSESDTDSELQNSFTTIELNSADITIHCTPVPEVNDGVDEDDDDDIYRKAASLGDLSKYETSKTTPTMLERAQSLDMTDTGSKKRKAPLPPPEDINESTEDLTKLDQIDTFDRRKLKKSSEWGTLEDAIGWRKTDENIHNSGVTVNDAGGTRIRKKSNGSGSTLERSKSAIDIKLKEESSQAPGSETSLNEQSETNDEVSVELYNLPLSKRLTEEFIRAERSFNPDEDNSLARIVNDGKIVKSPTLDEVELDFRQAKPLPSDDDDQSVSFSASDDEKTTKSSPSVNEDFNRALKYFETYSDPVPHLESESLKIDLTKGTGGEWKEEGEENKPMSPTSLYAGKKLVTEDLAMRITIDKGCRGCEERGSHNKSCQKFQQTPEKRGSLEDDLQAIKKKVQESERSVSPIHLRVQTSKSEPIRIFETKSDSPSLTTFQGRKTKVKQTESNDSYLPVASKSPVDEESSPFESHYAKRIVNISNSKIVDDEDEDEYEFGSSVTVNSKNLSESPKDDDRHNISNVSVSSGENSEDSGLVRESIDYNPSYDTENRPPLPSTPMPVTEVPRKMTYITEIKVSANRGRAEQDNENEEKSPQREIMITSNGKHIGGKKPPVPPRRSDITKTTKDNEKQVVYVSEYKPIPIEDSTVQDTSSSETKPLDVPSRKFEHWIFVGDNKEQNPWGNGSSPPQPVTNIMLSSDQKPLHQ